MNNYLRIENQIAKYEDLTVDNLTEEDREKLEYNFPDEQLELWVAAARKIGELAAKGSEECKGFMQDKLIKSDNIHQQRHALTILGSYFGHCENEKEQLNFLKVYDKNNDVIEKKSIKEFLYDNILEKLKKDMLLKDLIKQLKELEPQKELNRTVSSEEFELFKKHLFVIDQIEGKKRGIKYQLADEITNFSKIEKSKNYQELLFNLGQELSQENNFAEIITALEAKDNGLIDSLICSWKQEELLKELSLDNFPLHKIKTVFCCQKEVSDLYDDIYIREVKQKFSNLWYMPSLVIALDKIYLKIKDIKLVVRNLIDLAKNDIAYIKNLPYFFLKTIDQRGLDKVIAEFKEELLLFKEKIENQQLKIDKQHFSDLYFDLNFLFNKLVKADKQFALDNKVINLDSFITKEIVEKYKKLNQIDNDKQLKRKSLQLIETIRARFSEELNWKSLDAEEKNIKVIFDLIIKDESNKIDYSHRIKLVLAEINKWMTKNEELLSLFIRELKFLYFKYLTEKELNYLKQRTVKSKERLYEVGRFQVYSVIELLEKWNWEGIILKDVASIVINVFDVLWSTGQKKKAFKLLFTVFSYIPESKIINEMLYYSKNEELKVLLKVYKKCYKKNRNKNKYKKDSLTIGISEIRFLLKQKNDNIPQEIIRVYQVIEDLLLERRTKVSSIKGFNLFAIDKKIKLANENNGVKDIDEMFAIDRLVESGVKKRVNNKSDFDILEEYILEPIYNYQFIRNKNISFYLKKSLAEEKEEIETQVNIKCKEHINNLKEVIYSLDVEQDNYFSAFNNMQDFLKLDGISNKILQLLNRYRTLINILPVFERNQINKTVAEAEKNVLAEKNHALKINIPFKNKNEKRLKGVSNKLDDWEISLELKSKYQDIIYNCFLERGMFKEYNEELKDKKQDNTLLTSILVVLNNLILSPVIVALIILVPFLLSLTNKVSDFELLLVGGRGLHFIVEAIYFLYLIVIILFIFLNILFLSIKFLKFIFKAKVSKQKKQSYKFGFFLPKLIGVIFIIYMNFILEPKLWDATINIPIFLKLALIIAYLTFIYYFLDLAQFGNLNIDKKRKNKRIRGIMSMGLFYSFIINLLFVVTYSATFYTAGASDFFKRGVNKTSLLASVIPEVIINPELITFWTVQMFFIAIILEFFLQRRKIIADD